MIKQYRITNVLCRGILAGMVLLTGTTLLQEAAFASPDTLQSPAVTGTANNETDMVRIASWDLHDLWHEPGKPLRRGARIRSTADFDTLRRTAMTLNADIIALQGVGSPKAVRKLFPARDYYVIFSRELAVRMHRDRDILTNPARRRVYNAFAIRRAARLRILAREQVLELADPSPGLGPTRPQGQSALAVKVRINKRPIWVLSARLIGGCSVVTGGKSETSKKSGLTPHCTALRDQVMLLNTWRSRKLISQEAVVLAIALPQIAESTVGNTTIRSAWETLTSSDPIKIVAEYKLRTRAAGHSRGFALSNRIVNNRSGQFRQPNTVPLVGPSRRPGQRLVPLVVKDPASKNSNFVIDALTDFARTALKARTPKKPALEEQDVAAKPLTLAERTTAALSQIRGPVRPEKTTTPKYFIRYPAAQPSDACKTRQNGSNYLLVGRSFHDATKGIRFASAVTAKPSGSDRSLDTDCAVYLEIPR